MGLLPRLRAWVEAHLSRPYFSHIERVAELSAVPSKLARGTMYVAGPEQRPKWATFLCPCERGHVVSLTLQQSHWPHWRIDLTSGLPTVYPSVDVRQDPRCHYLVRGGGVTWVTWDEELDY